MLKILNNDKFTTAQNRHSLVSLKIPILNTPNNTQEGEEGGKGAVALPGSALVLLPSGPGGGRVMLLPPPPTFSFFWIFKPPTFKVLPLAKREGGARLGGGVVGGRGVFAPACRPVRRRLSIVCTATPPPPPSSRPSA